METPFPVGGVRFVRGRSRKPQTLVHDARRLNELVPEVRGVRDVARDPARPRDVRQRLDAVGVTGEAPEGRLDAPDGDDDLAGDAIFALNLAKHAGVLGEVEREYGVPGEIIVAIWGIESSFGGFSGNTDCVEALANIAWSRGVSGDVADAAYFRNELVEAARIVDKGLGLSRTTANESNAADGKGGFHPSGPLAPSSSRRGSQTEPGGTTRRSSSSASSWGTSIMGIFLISASELMCMFPRWCTSCLNRTSQVILKPSELSRKALRSSGSLKGELASSQA